MNGFDEFAEAGNLEPVAAVEETDNIPIHVSTETNVPGLPLLSPLSSGAASTTSISRSHNVNEETSTTTASLLANSTMTPEVLHFLPITRERSSSVWECFKILDPKYHPPIDGADAKMAKCKFCPKILNFSKGTSHLSRHIKEHRKTPNKDQVEKEQEKKRNFYERINAIPKKNVVERKRDMVEATACWVIEENVPFNMVEKKSFRRMCMTLSKEYQTITSDQVRNEIKSLGDVCKVAVKKELSGKYFALTTDHWTSKNNETYGCLTAHYVDNAQLKRCVLHFEVHHGTTTGEALFEQLLDVFKQYDFDLSFVTAVTTDTTGNMNTFGRRLQEKGVVHLYCVDHNLHLTCKLAFDDNNLPGSDNAMKAARSQVEFFNSSTQAMDKLFDIQKNFTRPGQTAVRPIQDVKTRWWSTWSMLERLLVLTPSIDTLIINKSVNTTALTETQKKVLTETESLLAPIAKCQKMLEGDKYPTVSSVPFMIWKMRKTLQGFSETTETTRSPPVVHLAQKMYTDFVDNRYGDGSIVFLPDYRLGRLQRYVSLHRIVIVAAFLDPRFKQLDPFVPKEEKDYVYQHVFTLMKATQPVEESTTVSTDTDRQPVNPVSTTSSTINGRAADDDDLFAELRTTNTLPDPDDVDHFATMCSVELERYKRINSILMQQDPLDWWSKNATTFPVLSILAMRYLAIPATSAASERLWSRASNIITKSRSQIRSHVVADLMFLKENGHILQKHAESIFGRTRMLPTVYPCSENNDIELKNN